MVPPVLELTIKTMPNDQSVEVMLNALLLPPMLTYHNSPTHQKLN